MLQGKEVNKNTVSRELFTLMESIGMSREIPEGASIFHEGMPADSIFVVKSGLIQIGKTSQEGKELTLRLCQEGAIIGELVLFSDDADYLLNARALKTSSVYAIDKKTLEYELMNNGALAVEFLKWSSDHMRTFQYKIRDLLLYGKKGALYSTLIRLSNSYGLEHHEGILINLDLTDTELASFAAATRESANRMLTDLRKRNVLSTLDSGEILIKDLEFLRNQIGCEDCPLVICNID